MIKKLLRIYLILLLSGSVHAQQINDTDVTEKSNPIIFGELFGGLVGMNHFGVCGGAELNYQNKKSLFTFRFTNVTGYIK